MGKRVVGGAAAIAVAAVVVVLALVAGGGGTGPRALPVLGAAGGGGGAAADEAAGMTLAGGVGGFAGYDLTGSTDGLPTEARAWSLGRDDADARVAALAEAFGLGEPVDDGERWTVEGPDGFLTVERQPGLPWYYSGPVVGGVDGVVSIDPMPADAPVSSDGSPPVAPTCAEGFCTEPGSPGCDDGGSTDPATSCAAPVVGCAMPECPPDTACIQSCPEPGLDAVPVPMPEPQRPADLPTPEEAEAIARDLLADVGVDLTGAETRVDDGFSTWAFVADPVIGGLPTFGMTMAVGVGAAGRVEYANGWLADPAEGDTYPLVGVEAALERLGQGAGGIAVGAPEPAADCLGCDDVAPAEPTVLDGVRVGLQLVPASGVDEAWLVPSYLFTIADGGPGAVVAAFAIADDLLAPPPGVEATQVAPVPVEPAPAPASAPAPDVVVLEPGQRAEVGTSYYVDISTHCGVTGMDFDGRLWDASPPLGDGSAPKGWAEPTEGGGVTLLSPDEAEFVGDAERTKVARFVPRPADAVPVGCQ